MSKDDIDFPTKQECPPHCRSYGPYHRCCNCQEPYRPTTEEINEVVDSVEKQVQQEWSKGEFRQAPTPEPPIYATGEMWTTHSKPESKYWNVIPFAVPIDEEGDSPIYLEVRVQRGYPQSSWITDQIRKFFMKPESKL